MHYFNLSSDFQNHVFLGSLRRLVIRRINLQTRGNYQVKFQEDSY